MKYKPQHYAQAFAEIAEKKLSAAEEKKILSNFFEAVKKHGDEKQLKKIVAEAERILRLKSGRRKVVLETAREVHPSPRTKFKALLEGDDIIEERVNPELVAGIKITINDETQFDGSLAKKLTALFKTEK